MIKLKEPHCFIENYYHVENKDCKWIGFTNKAFTLELLTKFFFSRGFDEVLADHNCLPMLRVKSPLMLIDAWNLFLYF